MAAKTGALLGVVRNEAGVVTVPDRSACAVALFTRNDAGTAMDPAAVDDAIGTIAGSLIGRLGGC